MHGQRIEGEEAVHKEAVRYFTIVLGASQLVDAQGLHRLGQFDRVLDPSQQRDMVRNVTMEEVKSAMFSFHSHKAPGPDEYNADFFKQN